MNDCHFHDMLHDFLNDYDDLVVKSKEIHNHVDVLREVFKRCRQYKLIMNPRNVLSEFRLEILGIHSA